MLSLQGNGQSRSRKEESGSFCFKYDSKQRIVVPTIPPERWCAPNTPVTLIKPLLSRRASVLIFPILLPRPMLAWLTGRQDRVTVLEMRFLVFVDKNNKSEPVSHWEKLVRIILLWCGHGDSNPNESLRRNLNPVCLPIPSCPRI